MDIFYENERGTIHFRGRGSGKDGFYIKKISGLGLPEKDCKVAVYVGQAGQELLSERDMERIITLSLDAYSKSSVQREVSRMLEVLYLPGSLSLSFCGMRRRIACRLTGMENIEKRGAKIRSLVLQFTCDVPYFTDDEVQQTTLFSRRDLVSGEFALPCVFTERTSRVMAVNQGTVLVEPVLKIFNTATEIQSRGIGVSKIDIVNYTTGGKVSLNYEMVPGEEVTIDIAARSIISNVKGNVLEALAPDCVLSDFYLAPGRNDVEIICNNAYADMTAVMKYNNQYVEAVF